MTYSEKDHKYIWHPFHSYSDKPDHIEIVKGKAEFLMDADGNSYIDANSSWWVNLHGHSHPYINQKIAEQLAELEHVIFSGMTHKPAVDLAERLVNFLGEGKIFFSDNGSTAVEIALKLAIQYWKNKGVNRSKFWAFEGSYHGDTFGSMSVSERDVFTNAFQTHMFDVEYFPIPTSENIEDILNAMKRAYEIEAPVAFIYEPLVQGAAGMRMYAPVHLNQILSFCKEQNIIRIADEVMTGFYRTGKAFASDYCEIKPNLICMSKGITGGYLPLGATWIDTEIQEEFKSKDSEKTFYHGHSYTGNPLACAAANASLQLLENKMVQQSISELCDKMSFLAQTWKRNPVLKDVRLFGTILAADINVEVDGYYYTHPIKSKIKEDALKAGILLRPMGNVIYLNPPYCISDDSLEKLDQFIAQLAI